MKHIFLWLLSLFIITSPLLLFAQKPSAVVLLTAKRSTSQYPISALPIPDFSLEHAALLPLPIYKLPKSYTKKYIIRVHQSDTAIFQKFIKALPTSLYYRRGVDHKGYDYFLPLAFDKKDQAETYLAQLTNPLYKQAVIVKNIPKNQKCNCFKRF